MTDDCEPLSPLVWTVGYGVWPPATRAARLIASLRDRGVTRLVDIRLSPCSSDPRPGRYGPKDWTLQAGEAGIAGLLAGAGIAYEWMVELGNPQRHDRTMAVLRAHLADVSGGWPVQRGLMRLAERVRQPGGVVALLCACAEARACHRSLIARELAARAFEGRLIVRDVGRG